MTQRDLRNVARSLRARAPATEKLIWDILRDRRSAGLKFRRQVPLGPYVVDFVCLRHRLIIEADGPFHDPGEDAAGDAWMRNQRFKVIRLPNGLVRDRLVASVLEVVGL